MGCSKKHGGSSCILRGTTKNHPCALHVQTSSSVEINEIDSWSNAQPVRSLMQIHWEDYQIPGKILLLQLHLQEFHYNKTRGAHVRWKLSSQNLPTQKKVFSINLLSPLPLINSPMHPMKLISQCIPSMPEKKLVQRCRFAKTNPIELLITG